MSEDVARLTLACMSDISFSNFTYNLIVLASALKGNQYPQCWFITQVVTTGNSASQIASGITHVIAKGILLANALV
jgi:hypothetical protein